MAKKNIRNVVKKPDSSNVLIDGGSCDYGKVQSMYGQTDANRDPELIPHCISSFCYLGLFVWLLLDKNYNRLLGRKSLSIVVTCYAIEFAKFACHTYLVSRLSSNQTWLKTNPILWIFQFVAYSVLAVAVAYMSSILFGAPVTTKQEQTLAFSVLITAVLVTPTAVQLGSNILPLLLTDCVDNEHFGSVEVYEKNNFRATILGAFVGTAVIPFDWETEWQLWPIPCSVGLIGGHLLANVYEIICWQFKSLKKYSTKKSKI